MLDGFAAGFFAADFFFAAGFFFVGDFVAVFLLVTDFLVWRRFTAAVRCPGTSAPGLTARFGATFS